MNRWRKNNIARKMIISKARKDISMTLDILESAKPFLIVDLKKGKNEMTVTIRGNLSGRTISQGVGKCKEGDVWNTEIYTALALDKALGVEESPYENPPQPKDSSILDDTEVIYE